VSSDLALALLGLSHRGSAAAGIAVCSPAVGIKVQRALGPVDRALAAIDTAQLPGHVGIAHVRYATSRSHSIEPRHTQPLLSPRVELALAHNGHLYNGTLGDSDASDSERLLAVLAQALADRLAAASADGEEFFDRVIVPAARDTESHFRDCGSYSLVALLGNGGLLAMRDPHGIRPLVLASEIGLEPRQVVASETTVLPLLGGRWRVEEVARGAILYIDPDGVLHRSATRAAHSAFCAFEPVYFAQLDSKLGNRSVFGYRRELGFALARQCHELRDRVDLVVPVPQTASVAATAVAEAWAKPLGGVERRATLRTFILPDAADRERAARLKYLFIDELLANRRLALVDDSLVRGTTARQLIRGLRSAGAAEVHLLVTFPPIQHACLYGFDFHGTDELEAASAGGSDREIAERIGANSVHFLSAPAVREALRRLGPLCMACADGLYPTRIAGERIAPVLSRAINKAS
jgi:amidophosphoribosyltransferase